MKTKMPPTAETAHRRSTLATVVSVCALIGCVTTTVVAIVRPVIAQHDTKQRAIRNERKISEVATETKAQIKASDVRHTTREREIEENYTRLSQQVSSIEAKQESLLSQVTALDRKAQEDRRHMLDMIQKILLNTGGGGG